MWWSGQEHSKFQVDKKRKEREGREVERKNLKKTLQSPDRSFNCWFKTRPVTLHEGHCVLCT